MTTELTLSQSQTKFVTSILRGAFVVGVLALFLLGREVLAERASGAPAESDGSGTFRLLAGAAYSVVLLGLLADWRRVLEVWRVQGWIVVLLCWVLASSTWSVEPEFSMRRGVALLGTTMCALYIAVYSPPRVFLRQIALVVAIGLVLSAIAVLVAPHFAIHSGDEHAGAWRGLFTHKNGLGRAAALGLVLFMLLAADSRGVERLTWVGLSVLSLVLLFPARSVTGQVLAVAMLICLPVAAIVRMRGLAVVPAWAITGALLALIVSAVVTNFAALLELFGREPTLTGRTLLWQVGFRSVLDRPLLGHGYGAFWLGEAGPSGGIYRLVGWTPSSGHNNFLDVWLELGLIGLVLTASLVLSTLGRAVAALRRVDGALTLTTFVLLAFLILSGTVETALVRQNSFFWVVFLVLALYFPQFRSRRGQPALSRFARGAAAGGGHSAQRRRGRSEFGS